MIASLIKKKQGFYKEMLKHLFFNKQLSCAELSSLISKSIPITTQYLNELIGLNLIFENGYAPSTGGRRPLTYSIKSDAFYVIAVAMDQLITRIALVSADNTIVGKIEKFDLTLANNPNSLNELTASIQSFIKSIGIPKEKITGIGIGMPGFVDAEKGVNYSFMPTHSGSIRCHIKNATGISAFIDNDSSLIGLAELKWGAARDKQNVMVLNVGWGIGLGIISNGKLFRGNDGFAGEFSHIPLFDNNKICSCGKYGCLETETSLGVIVQKAKEKLVSKAIPTRIKIPKNERIEDSAKKILEAAKVGDKFSIELLSEAAYNFGRGISILIHILNPDTIVISGMGSLAGKVWIAPIQQAINEHCIPRLAEQVQILMSSISYDSEILGAVALVLENFESTPTFIGSQKLEKIKK